MVKVRFVQGVQQQQLHTKLQCGQQIQLLLPLRHICQTIDSCLHDDHGYSDVPSLPQAATALCIRQAM